MVFRFLHIHGEAGKCYITGCFERCTEPEEKELLDMMYEGIGELNMAFKCDKIVLKDKTIFFRGINADWLLSTLIYWNTCLDLSLKYRVGKNVTYTGDRAKELFDEALRKYSISVI